MNCPKCGESLKDDAKVCFSCGEVMKSDGIDELIDSMIKEDEAAQAKTPEKTELPAKKKLGKKVNKETVVSKESSTGKVKKAKPVKDESGKITFGKGVDIVRYVTAAIIIAMLLTMLTGWFALGGRGAFIGFELDQNSKEFMASDVQSMQSSDIEKLAPEQEVLVFSPKDLIDYVDLYEDSYTTLENSDKEPRTSWAVIIQTLYIRGFYLILAIGIFSVILVVLDRRLKTTEWIRGFSVLSMVIIALNYVALRIPFFSMFALKARSILRVKEPLSSVTMNINGVNVNNDFYPYEFMEMNGFYAALVLCVLWFILTTVLVEMKKDKEYR